MGFSYINGGNPNVWKILAAPPVDSAMILDPETYDPTPEINVDYAGLLTGVEKYFGDKEWDIQNIEIPKMTLHQKSPLDHNQSNLEIRQYAADNPDQKAL